MTALLLTAALAGGAGVAVELPPATALALDVAKAVGATVTRIAVTPDDSVTAGERVAIDAAFARTELFVLVEPAHAAAVVKIARIDPATLVATVVGAQGEVLWAGRAAWPAQPAATTTRERIATAGPANEEERRLGLERFARQRLRVTVLAQSHFGLPAILGDDPSPTKQWQGDPATRAARWGAGRPHGGTALVRKDWVIVRGPEELITDVELAELLENRQLAERIEAARFWPRLFWVGGFGLGAATGITAGAFLVQSDDRDTRTVGVSLIAVGVVSAVLALLYPSVGADHVLERAEARAYCDEYNEQLRKALRLSESDVAPLSGAERPASIGD